MEYRKLIRFGNSSFVISLPKKWLKNHDLKKGDTISLDMNGSDITLYPGEGVPEKKEIESIINADDLSMEVIERKIVAAYINNADVITVKASDMPQKVKGIKKTIQNLVAMEIIEQTTDKVVVKSFLNIEDVEIANILRKADHILITMFEDLDKIAKNDALKAVEISDNITQRDEDVNRMCFLMFRAINHEIRAKHGKTTDILKLWGLTFFLEQIADEVKRIGRILARIDKEVIEDYMLVVEKTRENYKNAMKACFSHDKETVYDIAERKNNLLKICDDIVEKNTKNPLVLSMIDRTRAMISKIHNINRMSY